MLRPMTSPFLSWPARPSGTGKHKSNPKADLVVHLTRSGAIVGSLDAEDRSDLLLAYPVRQMRAGEYLYVRVVQRDGGAAWSSPFFVE